MNNASPQYSVPTRDFLGAGKVIRYQRVLRRNAAIGPLVVPRILVLHFRVRLSTYQDDDGGKSNPSHEADERRRTNRRS